MQLLTYALMFAKSRQKLLLKRRKRQIRSRPVSKKYLKEQRKIMNFSFQTKLMDIKKIIDNKKSQNHHLNQVIQELFYQDIRPQHPSLVEKQLKQSTNNLNIPPQDFQNYLNQDDLSQRIKETLLPLDLLQLHQQNQQQFSLHHYEYLLRKLNYSATNAEQIKQKLLLKRNKQASRIRDGVTRSAMTAKPSFILLQSDEIVRHELWSEVVVGIQNKMKSLRSLLPEFNAYIKIVLLISKYFKFVPASLYQLIISTNISFPFKELKPLDISRLVNLLRLRYNVRYEPNIKIQNPEQVIPKESHSQFLRRLCSSIINDFRQYKAIDFINIFYMVHAYEKKMTLLSEELLTHSQYIFSSIINELSFQQVEMYLNIYMHNKLQPNMDFVQIVKFDLYRKCHSCTKEYVLLSLMTRIRGHRLTFRNNNRRVDSSSFNSTEGHHLILKLSEAITKHISKLSPFQLIKLIDIYFCNQIREASLLLVVATQFTKKCISANVKRIEGSQSALISLEFVAKSFFRLTILGYRSRMLAKLVSQQFIQNYHSLDKDYRSKQVLLLPSDEKKYNQPYLDFRQIHLQECLLMTIWAIIQQFTYNEDSFDRKTQQQLLRLIPLQIDSIDPLAIQLIHNINQQLQPYHLYPTIPVPAFIPHIFPTARLAQFYEANLSKSAPQILMGKEAFLSGNFVANYNYKEGLFLRQGWSSVLTYRVQDYIEYCSRQQGEQVCYFNKQVMLPMELSQRRKAMVEDNGVSDEKKSERQHKNKIYDLL